MEDKLDLIIQQNWILLGLLGVIFLCNFFCNYKNIKSSKPIEIDLYDLWKTDQIDRLLEISDERLNKKPNDELALFLRGKALYKTEKYEAALHCFRRLRSFNPSFNTETDSYISDLEVKLGDNSHEVSAKNS